MEAEEKEPVVNTESLKEHEPKHGSDSKVFDPDNNERGDKEDQDDKANQVKDKESARETVPPKKQAPLTAKCELESSVPNSIKDVDDENSETTENPIRRSPLISEGKADLNSPDSVDIETKNNKTNQVEGKESVEATESPRRHISGSDTPNSDDTKDKNNKEEKKEPEPDNDEEDDKKENTEAKEREPTEAAELPREHE